MTAPDYVTQAAELLSKHRPRGFSYRDECSCGWSIPDRAGWADRRAHDTHVAEVLAAAGLIPTSTETRIDYASRHDAAHGVRVHAILQTRAVTDWKDATDD